MADNVIQIIIRAKNELGKDLKSTDAELAKLATGFGVAAAAAAAVGLAIFKLAENFAKLSDELNKASAQTGISVEELSRLKLVAAQSETSFEALSRGLLIFNRNLFDFRQGAGESVAAFRALGITAADLAGKGTEGTFGLVAERLAQVGDAGTRSALAMKIFGRSGAELVPLLKALGDGTAISRAEMEQLGAIISADATALGDEFGDQLELVNAQLDGLKAQLAVNFIPLLLELLPHVQNLVKAFTDWARAAGDVSRFLTGVSTGARIGLGFSVEQKRPRIPGPLDDDLVALMGTGGKVPSALAVATEATKAYTVSVREGLGALHDFITFGQQFTVPAFMPFPGAPERVGITAGQEAEVDRMIDSAVKQAEAFDSFSQSLASGLQGLFSAVFNSILQGGLNVESFLKGLLSTLFNFGISSLFGGFNPLGALFSASAGGRGGAVPAFAGAGGVTFNVTVNTMDAAGFRDNIRSGDFARELNRAARLGRL